MSYFSLSGCNVGNLIPALKWQTQRWKNIKSLRTSICYLDFIVILIPAERGECNVTQWWVNRNLNWGWYGSWNLWSRSRSRRICILFRCLQLKNSYKNAALKIKKNTKHFLQQPIVKFKCRVISVKMMSLTDRVCFIKMILSFRPFPLNFKMGKTKIKIKMKAYTL